jgi:chromosome partition protein MukB
MKKHDVAEILRVTLINFNGFDYAEFDMNPRMTTLEGINGAGKTTVMVGSYVPLMPDQNFLRFKNVSESDQVKTDATLYDRLGSAGDISYSVLTIRLSSGDLIHIGVEIIKKSLKKMDLTPFILRDVRPEMPLHDVMLPIDAQGNPMITPLVELTAHWVSVGATPRKFHKVTDYFTAIFEAGVVPTLMTMPTDRAKYHKLMMASFYGGLTGDLQKSIKDYLLPPSDEISSSVQNASRLLNEVKSTKRSIENAQQIYSRVSQVDASAFKLIASAYYGAQQEYSKQKADARTARTDFRLAKQNYRERKIAFEMVERRVQSIEREIPEAKNRRDAAAEREKVHAEASRLSNEIDRHNPRLAELNGVHEEAVQQLQLATERRDVAQRNYQAALADQRKLGDALGDAAKSFEEISRKVGLYHAAMGVLGRLRKLVGEPDFESDAAPLRKKQIEQQIADARTELAPLIRSLQNAEDQAQAYRPVVEALGRLGGIATSSTAYLVASDVLARIRGRRDLVRSCEGIEPKLRQARKNAQYQATVRRLVGDLSAFGLLVSTPEHLRAEIQVVAERRATWQRTKDQCAAAISQLQERQGLVMLTVQKLSEALHQWRAMDDARSKLAKSTGPACSDAFAVKQLISDLTSQAQELDRQEARDKLAMADLEQQIAGLNETGLPIGNEISRMAELVGGRLLPDIYEDVSTEDARLIESRVGPLISAIVVDDIDRAAHAIAEQQHGSGAFWLVQEDDISAMPAPTPYRQLAAVQIGVATHLAVPSKNPVLGRAARSAQIARLETELDVIEQRLDDARERLRAAHDQLDLARRLAHYGALIVTNSPEQELNDQQALLRDIKSMIDASHRQNSETERELKQCDELRLHLDACNEYASFLDGENWADTLSQLTDQSNNGAAAKRELAADDRDIQVLTAGIEVLRSPPLGAAETQQIVKQVAALNTSITNWNETSETLAEVLRVDSHFAYEPQVEIEKKEKGFLGDLQRQAGEMAAQVGALNDVREDAETARSLADNARSDAHSKLTGLQGRITDLQERLDRLGVPADEAALAAARELVAETIDAVERLEQQNNDLRETFGSMRSDKDRAYEDLVGAQDNTLTRCQHHLRELIRVARRWHPISDAVQSIDPYLHTRLQEPEAEAMYSTQSWTTLNELQPSNRMDLVKALEEAGVHDLLARHAGTQPPIDTLGDWKRVQRFLQQSLPRDVTDTDNVQEALREMMTALERLRIKQNEQEMKFRTSAESLSNGISNLVRRHIAQINRINSSKNLSEIRFGSLTGIKIVAERADRMGDFLAALKIEPDMFSDDRTLEEALEKLYTKTTGASATGGNLLDYRRYIDVTIQIRRLGKANWDTNIGSSSGEAIGVGCAILCVILDAMQRQSEALHNRRIKGSIRFLMIDEANRLHSETLEVLATFCENMGVQLLVAAPEVGKARTGTTYCLVRRLGETGQEVDVTYRGRRGFQLQDSA